MLPNGGNLINGVKEELQPCFRNSKVVADLNLSRNFFFFLAKEIVLATFSSFYFGPNKIGFQYRFLSKEELVTLKILPSHKETSYNYFDGALMVEDILVKKVFNSNILKLSK
jgi:hypothetical protein